MRFGSVEALLDFIFSPPALCIRPSQIREEIDPVLRLVAARRARTILEIGTNNGGTLFLWTRVAAEDATVVSLDLPGGEFGGGYPAWKRPLYRAFALPNQRVHLLQGDSHQPKSLAMVREVLGSREVDVLFIDGDHTYEGVKMDFEMYAPLVRQGGLIVFHDIAEHADRSCQVRRFWSEISASRAAREFVALPPAGWAGIGVLESVNQENAGRPAALA
jgi:predicted O-methyltransferase YrrM